MAITTVFDGIEYRSRLEARWGAFFAQLGWHFTYEPFDGDGYIPDFLVHGDRPFLVEVKPAATLVEYERPIAKMTRGVAQHWDHDLLIVGVDPLPAFRSDAWGGPVAGLMGEPAHEAGDWWFSVALWSVCNDCKQTHIGLWHDTGLYAHRPCNRGRGDKSWSIGRHHITKAWADATNAVKWRGRAAEATA